MDSLAALLRGLLRVAIVGALVIAGIVGFFVAWWLALLAVLALSAYIGIRRFFGLQRPSPSPGPGAPGAAGTVIIEGEYEVERDADGATRTHGRVIEVRPGPEGTSGNDHNRP